MSFILWIKISLVPTRKIRKQKYTFFYLGKSLKMSIYTGMNID